MKEQHILAERRFNAYKSIFLCCRHIILLQCQSAFLIVRQSRNQNKRLKHIDGLDEKLEILFNPFDIRVIHGEIFSEKQYSDG